ncbi:MAG TPA: universal stress protein [Actinoplanes sp.]|nr:universal stress protein [Actinoplanes sp.]
MSSPTIIVGYDGSPEAEQAARWAFSEAERTRAAVELVYAWAWPAYLPATPMVPGSSIWPDTSVEAAIDTMMADAVAVARRSHPSCPITGVIEHGPPAVVLRDRAKDAQLLVVGGRSHGAIAGLLLGSVASAIAAHAPCSVIVCRGGEQAFDNRPVVVGLDDSERAASAARFALDQAAARGVAVRAVRAWMPPPDPWIGSHFVNRAEIAKTEHASLRDQLAGLREDFPGVPVTAEAVIGHPRRVLTDAAQHGQLIVVAARGRGGFHGLRLGSVSHHLLLHSPCTVAVLRDPPAPRDLDDVS